MRARKIYLVLIIFTIFASSCNDFFDREIPPPAYEENIVIYSFLDPANPAITVRVNRTVPVFGDRNKINALDQNVNDAQVTITDGTNTASIPHVLGGEGGVYRLETGFTLRHGETYTVSAVIDGKTVYGSATIPMSKIDESSFTMKFDTVSFTDLLGDKSKTGLASVKFNDISGEENFYYIDGWLDDNGFSYIDLNFGDGYHTIQDEGKDGQTLGPFVGQAYLGQGLDLTGFKGKFEIQVCDEAMYRYYRYLNAFNAEDGFFIEPSITYSNVENGLGVIAARVSSSFSVDL